MRREYDFSRSRPNPYPKLLKRQITIRLDASSVEYFKQAAEELGMGYQNLINLYLRDCTMNRRKPSFVWSEPDKRAGTGGGQKKRVR